MINFFIGVALFLPKCSYFIIVLRNMFIVSIIINNNAIMMIIIILPTKTLIHVINKCIYSIMKKKVLGHLLNL